MSEQAPQALPGQVWRGTEEDTGLPCAIARDPEDGGYVPHLYVHIEWRQAYGPTWSRIMVAWAIYEQQRADAERALRKAETHLRQAVWENDVAGGEHDEVPLKTAVEKAIAELRELGAEP